MTRRNALAVFAAAAALLVALNALVYSLYRHEVRSVTRTLDDRLVALGTTAARWLAAGGPDPAAVLQALVATNQLEDAYVVDGRFTVTAGVRTQTGSRLNLMRVDEDRLAAAFDGAASSGYAYALDKARVQAAYFPVTCGSARCVLALEAGAEYHAPATSLLTTYLGAVALTGLLALVFTTAGILALRALERSRLAHGRAERLAAVGQVAAMVAHEVRNPLGILRGQVELARERLDASAPARERERFGEMLAEIDRLNALTEEFLGLTRDHPPELASLDLGELAVQIVEEARLDRRVEEANLEAVSPPEPVRVAGDPARLRQAIHNLVWNAIQIGGAGVSVRVEVAGGARARVTVSDDGPGVPPELTDRLFEPFVTTRAGGSGLGLAVARKVAESHGGALVLEPAGGARGARFSIYLPLERR